MGKTWPLIGTLLIALTLTGCTGQDDAAAPGGTPESPPSAASSAPEPGTEESDDLVGLEGAVPTLPDGRFDQVRAVPRPDYKARYGGSSADAVFTDDQVIFGDRHGFLWSLDRATGEKQWKVRMRSTTSGSASLCDLVIPSETARTVVASDGGSFCGDFTAYNLTNGKIVAKYASVEEEAAAVGFDLGTASDLVRLGGRVYWVDADNNLRRVEDNGRSSVLGDVEALVAGDASVEYNVSRLQPLPGTDLLLARLQVSGGIDASFGEEQEDGLIIAVRVSETDQPELVWKQVTRRLMKRSAGHQNGSFRMEGVLPGLITDVQARGKRRSLRVRALSPTTGELTGRGARVPLSSGASAEVPSFLDSFGAATTLSAGEGVLFAPVERADKPSFSAVARYDLDSGRQTWKWRLPDPTQPVSLPSATLRVLATSEDRSVVYVLAQQSTVNTLWALDYESGETVSRWKIANPSGSPVLYNIYQTYVDEGDLLRISGTDLSRFKSVASLLRLRPEGSQ